MSLWFPPIENQQLDEYFNQSLSLVVSGKAREAFDLGQESEAVRESYGRNTFGQIATSEDTHANLAFGELIINR